MERKKRITHSVDEAKIIENAGTDHAKIDFAKIFDMLLCTKGIDQEKMAEETGISTGSISNYRKGKSEPTLGKIRTIANYLGVDCNYLMTGIQSKNAGVCGKTGLSEKALENIQNITLESQEEDSCYATIIGTKRDILNAFLASDSFPDIIAAIYSIKRDKYCATQPFPDCTDEEREKHLINAELELAKAFGANAVIYDSAERSADISRYIVSQLFSKTVEIITYPASKEEGRKWHHSKN